jgi:cell division protein FtsB
MSTESSSFGKRTISFIFLFISLLLVVSLSKGVFELLAVYDRVDLAELEVKELEAKQLSLQRQLKERSTEGYVERQIRNKLHLSRPGEVVVVLPERELTTLVPLENEERVVKKENWQKWLELFL